MRLCCSSFALILVLCRTLQAQEPLERTDPSGEQPVAEPEAHVGPEAMGGEPADADAADDAADDDDEGGAEAFADLEEGFGARSSDGRRELRISPLFAVRGVIAKPEGQAADGEVRLRLGRLTLMGHFAGGLVRYFFQIEMAGGPQLLDLQLTLALMPELMIRVGRFRTPFLRQFIEPLFAMQLPTRSIVSDFSRADRDTGISLEGRAVDAMLEYRLGVYDERLTATPLVVARVALDPLGAMAYDETTARLPGEPRLSVGVSAYRGGRRAEQTRVDPMTDEVLTVEGPEILRSAVGLDAMVRVGPFGATAEAFLDRREDELGDVQVGLGAFVQAGVFVWQDWIEIAARYDWLTPDESLSMRGLQRGELGGTLYFLNARLKLQTSYVYTRIDAAVAALVPAFEGHAVDLQMLLFF